jgi:hypothetical protein
VQTIGTRRHPRYRAIAGALVILFLASVARFYHPRTGFTAFIAFPPGHEHVSAAMRDTPHEHVSEPYDGQFYAQRALDPLLRDPAYDRAMDLAPYRARRILFSWTAYALGLGRPAWILQAYALQNVICWLLLAALLVRWLPLTTARSVALWGACLFSHGMLWSVRFALLDVPSVLLIAAAVALVEKRRPLIAAVVTGIAGLGRETNVLALAAQPIPRAGRCWGRLTLAIVLAAAPLLIWLDYLRSIYRSTVSSGTSQLALPGTALAATWRDVLSEAVQAGTVLSLRGLWLCLLLSLAVQALYMLVRREYSAPWWRVAVVYGLLMLLLDRILADPNTGAISRVLLPLTIGFNILLASEPRGLRFWPWFAAGNAHVIAAPFVMPLIPWW